MVTGRCSSLVQTLIVGIFTFPCTKTPDEGLLYLTVCLPTSLCDDDGPGESLLSLVAPGRSAE